MSIRQQAHRSLVGSSGYSVDQNSSGQTFSENEVFLSVVRAGAGLKKGANGEEGVPIEFRGPCVLGRSGGKISRSAR